MDAPGLVWFCRVVWLTLPVTLGDALGAALSGRDRAATWVVVGALWALWAVGLVALAVPHPAGLTALRVLAPVPLVAGAVAAAAVTPGPLGWTGLVAAALIAVAPFSSAVGEWAINGTSYGDERWMPLRAPAPLLLGPIELAWAIAVAPFVVAACAALGSNLPVAGAALVVGLLGAWFAVRSLHRLTRRALVFVPAGMTLVDDLAVAEPILFPRRAVVRFGPAPADTSALDLTAGATGLVLQIDLDDPVSLVPAVRRGAVAEAVDTSAALIATSRPGAVLRLAEERQVRVSRV
ncbi:MAG: hypothetical protein ACOYML_01785 [Microthrixaceae bacterium]|jgi:hypothetical protein